MIWEKRNRNSSLPSPSPIVLSAVAEEQLQFEHRDLHWGNLLVREESAAAGSASASASASDDEGGGRGRRSVLRYRVSGREFAVRADRVRVTIIDFSLSRSVRWQAAT